MTAAQHNKSRQNSGRTDEEVAQLIADYNGTSVDQELDKMAYDEANREPVMDEFGDWE